MLNCMTHRRAMHNQRGFTLVEMALALLVLGFFVGSVISFIELDDDKRALQLTQERQKTVAVAISDFANRFGYVPCAAAFNVGSDEFGVQATGANCNDAAERMGMVPFRTLGIPMENVYDGYGNLMTYIVFQTALDAQSNNTIHQNCRSTARGWHDGSSNVNPIKARFCCAQDNSAASEGVFINDAMTQSAWPFLQRNESLPVGEWSHFNTQYAGALHDRSLSYFAYNLISFGKNGSGARVFRGDGNAAGQITGEGTGFASLVDDPTQPSAVAANVYRSVRPWLLARGEHYYDNIVLWRTQDQVISETGLANCRTP